MGRHHMKDVLGNHLKDQLSRLIHWLSITQYLRKTSQESINLDRKCYLDCPSDTHCTRGEFGRGTHWLQTLGAGKDGRIRNLCEKTQCIGSNITTQKEDNLFFQPQMTNHTFWKRSGTENTHLDTGSPNSRRRSTRFFRRIRRVSTTTSRLTSGCRWSTNGFLVHVGKLHIPPSRWTQSQTLLAERRIVPYSTEVGVFAQARCARCFVTVGVWP